MCGTIILMRHCAFPFLVLVFVLLSICICDYLYLYLWVLVFVFLSWSELKVAGEGGRCGTIILTRYCAFLFLIFVFVLVSIYTCISIFVSIGICICETSELKVAGEGERCWEVWNNNLNEALCFSNVSLCTALERRVKKTKKRFERNPTWALASQHFPFFRE